ncbi:PucR family transcriptional regulator [Streptomyces vinaceus]|uniref:PucR family transcriptional regulator n=1 Tax=Streptomyces vinaceus TaxID=1960 RepID=A0A5J6JE14_STRVI|nr:helix-turn-helix domain-containing protein [Streptomyces vinaceus]QEV48755.1 PucR family transcriptional regulator [Streptomyces vinaceus]GHE37021.1 PucR family transcriptional regulator [Streptomyces vinaceus]
MERIIEEIREDLSRRITVTADRLAARTLAEDPVYAALLGRAGLRERIRLDLRQSVEGLDRALRGLPVELAEARATGALLAGAGLPLASLLRTRRRGGRMVWQTLGEAVAAHDPAALPRLLPAAAVLWDVQDQLTDAVSEAYRRTETARRDHERERRSALLDALLDGAGPADGPAAELGLPGRGRFAVVVLAPGASGASGESGSSGDPLCASDPFDAGGPRVLWRIRAEGETGLVELGHHPLESVRDTLAPPGARAGVSPVVETPADLARARRLAALALRTAPASGGPRTALLDERLPAALVASQAELAGRLRQVVLGPVLALPAEDLRVLLTTLGTWLTCQGSTTYAAQRLYCHRNTVSNRLRRLERLTGRTLSDPAHVVELALAHAAVLQRADDRVTAPIAQAPPSAPAAPTPAGTVRRSPRPPA